MKQRPAISESSSSPPPTSVSAPAHLNVYHAHILSAASATRKTRLTAGGSKIAFTRSNERMIANLAALAMRVLFVVALVAFLRALLGLDPLPFPVSHFSDQVAATSDSPLHHRALRALRAAHEPFDHAHPLAVDLDGHVTLAHEYTQAIAPSGTISVNVNWPWMAVELEDGSTSERVPDSKDRADAEVVEIAVEANDGLPVAEDSMVHPVRVHLPGEEDKHRDGRARQHGRRGKRPMH